MNRQRIVWCLLLVTLLQLWMVINGIQAAKGHQKQRVSRAITRRQLYRKVSHIETVIIEHYRYGYSKRDQRVSLRCIQ